MSVDFVQFPPPPCSPPVDAPVLTVAGLAGAGRDPWEHVDSELRVFVDFVQSDGFIQLSLRLNDAGISLLVHPLDCEVLVLGKPADVLHLSHQEGEGDAVVDVGDEHLSIVCSLHTDLRNVAVVEPLVRLSRVNSHLV